jgi:hypothetical protein
LWIERRDFSRGRFPQIAVKQLCDANDMPRPLSAKTRHCNAALNGRNLGLGKMGNRRKLAK